MRKFISANVVDKGTGYRGVESIASQRSGHLLGRRCQLGGVWRRWSYRSRARQRYRRRDANDLCGALSCSAPAEAAGVAAAILGLGIATCGDLGDTKCSMQAPRIDPATK
jgi:hypothetical protein